MKRDKSHATVLWEFLWLNLCVFRNMNGVLPSILELVWQLATEELAYMTLQKLETWSRNGFLSIRYSITSLHLLLSDTMWFRHTLQWVFLILARFHYFWMEAFPGVDIVNEFRVALLCCADIKHVNCLKLGTRLALFHHSVVIQL